MPSSPTEADVAVHEVADELVRVVDAAAEKLRARDEAAVSARPAPGKWSAREIVGHLLDSAVNNHHRFVRAQQQDGELVFPRYEQDSWVALQDYQAAPWPELVELWRLYNRHLAHVMRRIDPARLGTVCRIGPYEPATLRFLVADYLVHLKHHLGQVDAL